MFCGALLKTVLTWTLTPIFGLTGAAWATNLGFTLAALGNLTVLSYLLGTVIDTDRSILRPTLASFLMGLGLFALKQPLTEASALTQLSIMISCGAIIYLAGIVLTRCISEADVEFLPPLRKLMI
jgi:stage V sporulation protein B